MTCNCQKPTHALYAKSDEYADVAHCNECKFENAHNCGRFTSMITGLASIVTCEEARTDESLCGVLGRLWIKKEG